MIRIKSVSLFAVLMGAMTAAFLYIAQTCCDSEPTVERTHARVQDILKEKLTNAEQSLSLQAWDLAGGAAFISELARVQEKLQHATPGELKQQTKNTWNNAVFDRLIDWKDSRSFQIKQEKASAMDRTDIPYGSMTAQNAPINWWSKAPDLALAFAAVPMKDGELSATLVAYGTNGKQLQNGKRYDEDIPALREVARTKKTLVTLLGWDGGLYAVAIHPVMDGERFIGIVVVGAELSKAALESFQRAMPQFIELAFVYAKPRLGAKGSQIVVANDDVRDALESGAFQRLDKADGRTVKFYETAAGVAYVNRHDVRKMAMTRLPWLWNDGAEVDFYIATDLNGAGAMHAALVRHAVASAVVIFAVGALLILIFIQTILKKIAVVRKDIAQAISSGAPIDQNALAAITGESPDALAQYVIRPLEDTKNQDEEDWSSLMMDLDDENNANSDSAVSCEEMARIKENADLQEARELFETYMERRKENHIQTPMDFDCFLRRLQRNIDKIKNTHHCKAVHFEVKVSDGNVLLKPKIEK